MVPEFQSGSSLECCWLIYGGLIFGYGVCRVVDAAPIRRWLQLTNLHAPIWWGGLLTILGVVYVVKFRPGQSK